MINKIPHPIPYQGSKRKLASTILEFVEGKKFDNFYEPFAGSAAVTLAAARMCLATNFHISDSLEPLAGIWKHIIYDPKMLADDYETLWSAQEGDAEHYNRIRSEFNDDSDPAKLLYLLARCVKNSPRFNQDGKFNQSPDHRRKGMAPTKMRRELTEAHAVLKGRTRARGCDFQKLLISATSSDIVYMDPPYQGVSGSKDTRYHQGLSIERLIDVLTDLQSRDVSILLSYDGRCGNKTYGEPLPETLNLVRVNVIAGRSAQATLNGKDHQTVESLYISRKLYKEQGIMTT